jgi:hypothetical protein
MLATIVITVDKASDEAHQGNDEAEEIEREYDQALLVRVRNTVAESECGSFRGG